MFLLQLGPDLGLFDVIDICFWRSVGIVILWITELKFRELLKYMVCQF